MTYTPYQDKTKKVISLILIALLGSISFVYYWSLTDLNRQGLEILTTINWALVSVILAYTLPKGAASICNIFFITFGVFHTGLVFTNAIGAITDSDTLYQIKFWFYSQETTNAIYLINLAFFGFSTAAILFSQKSKSLQDSFEEQKNRRLHHIGGLILLATISLFFLIAIATGAIHSYGAYLNVVSSSGLYGILFTYCYVFIGLSLVLVTVTHKKSYGYLYFIAFAIWSLMAFKLGLRGEVMFPSAVTACVLARKGVSINGFLLVGLLICFLIVTSIVKSARVSGDYSSNLSLNPLNSVAEMGASLRPVQEVIKWRKSGDPLLLGASYWAPFERQLALVIPGMSRKPALEDARLLNVVVDQKAGPIGFSPVAEAYINFGEKGVLLVFFIVGFLLATLDNKPAKIKTDILIGVSLIPVFIMIRNSFAHVPVQIIISFAFAIVCMYGANIKYKW